MKDLKDVHILLQKPIWQMTGEEFLQLNELTRNSSADSAENGNTSCMLVYGVSDLAKIIGCCQSTVYTLKKQGIFDDAIVSHIGKKIVFDAEKARKLADEYQKSQREIREQP